MSAVTLDSAAFTAPAGLDLGTVSGGHPEKIVKFRIGLFSYKNRRKDVFEAADDISSVSLITESVVRFGVFIDLPIRRGFREGGKVGRKEGYRKSDEDMKAQYAEEIKLLKKSYSLRNVSKLTGTSVNTLRKLQVFV